MLLGLFACFIMPTEADDQWKNHLGKGFYLPHMEIDVPSSGGNTVFTLIPDICIHKAKEHSTVNEQINFKDTRTFYRSVATEAGLSAKLTGKFTMGTTLKAKSTNVSVGDVEVIGSSIVINNQGTSVVLDKDCITRSNTSLWDDLIKDLSDLPKEVSRPELKTSWDKYSSFLTKYGSHVVTQTYYGTSITVDIFKDGEPIFTGADK